MERNDGLLHFGGQRPDSGIFPGKSHSQASVAEIRKVLDCAEH